VNVEDMFQHFGFGFRIEVAGRFIHEKNVRVVGKGAGNGNPLLLTARKFGRLRVSFFGKPYNASNFSAFTFCSFGGIFPNIIAV
jgi:hypothetical protein